MKPRLENWKYNEDGKTLRGDVYDYEGLEDGTTVITAPVVKMGLLKKSVETETLTFKLGKKKNGE